MKTIMHNIRLNSIWIAAVTLVASLSSCGEEELGPTIFPEGPDETETSYTYKFDHWLNESFRDIYNLDLKYKLADVEVNMQYNLTPVTIDNAKSLSVLIKYLWFDAYAELTGKQFLQQYGPRIINLVGSPAYNPSSGTETLGLAERGIKVSLFKVNEMNPADIEMLNEFYFRTMHHEFGHILHQTKSYPTEFNLLSSNFYDSSTWQLRNMAVTASMGFVTNYASSQPREDFAEVIANYVTRTDDQLDLIRWFASLGWASDSSGGYCSYYLYEDEEDRLAQKPTYIYRMFDRPAIARGTLVDGVPFDPVDKEGNELQSGRLYKVCVYDPTCRQYFSTLNSALAHLDELKEKYGEVIAVPDTDGVNGADIIRQKETIVRNWFKDIWHIDFDKLRKIVLRRQADIDLQSLLNEIENIQQ